MNLQYIKPPDVRDVEQMLLEIEMGERQEVHRTGKAHNLKDTHGPLRNSVAISSKIFSGRGGSSEDLPTSCAGISSGISILSHHLLVVQLPRAPVSNPSKLRFTKLGLDGSFFAVSLVLSLGCSFTHPRKSHIIARHGEFVSKMVGVVA